MSQLVIDVGTSSIRTVVIRPDATCVAEKRVPFLPSSPFPGAVEFDAAEMARLILELAHQTLAASGPVLGVGITAQRASTIVWDRATGEPVAPGIGWQDLRTAGTCLVLQAQNIRLAPNMSATKLLYLLDLVDPDRTRDLCFGTVDSWVAWTLSGGSIHVTDSTNAAITGLTKIVDSQIVWDADMLAALNIPASVLPRIVDSSGIVGPARVLPNEPPIAGIAGDQQSSLVGQGCVQHGLAKLTFGTGGMFDMCLGSPPPTLVGRGKAGAFPIVAWQREGSLTWGVEAIMLTAGTCVEWLRDDLQIIESAADSERVAARCATTGDVWFVPALLGLGTPDWDYGARGTLVGMTRGTGRPEIVRAVLEGVAHRGADLLEAGEADGGARVVSMRVDGGMTENRIFLQAFADATQRAIEVSPAREATALGAGFLAGLALGTFGSLDDIAATWEPSLVIEPRLKPASNRDRWREARSRSKGWLGDFSSLDF